MLRTAQKNEMNRLYFKRTNYIKRRCKLEAKTNSPKGIIEYIEGIGEARGQKLIDAGIRTLEDLEKIDVEVTAGETGISSKLLIKYVAMAKLQRITGIDKQYAEALVLMGIDSFTGLASTNPEMIDAEMREYDHEDIIPETPELHEVMKWQEESVKLIEPDLNVKYGKVSCPRHAQDKVVFIDKEIKDIPDGVTFTITKFYKRKPLVRLDCLSHQYVPASGVRTVDRLYVPLENIPPGKKIRDKLIVKQGRLIEDLPEIEKLRLLAQQFPTYHIFREIIFNRHLVVDIVEKNKINIGEPEYRLCDEAKNLLFVKVMREVKTW
jgi:predicted flap endonuclease-1-like 5' DNA nuclease